MNRDQAEYALVHLKRAEAELDQIATTTVQSTVPSCFQAALLEINKALAILRAAAEPADLQTAGASGLAAHGAASFPWNQSDSMQTDPYASHSLRPGLSFPQTVQTAQMRAQGWGDRIGGLDPSIVAALSRLPEVGGPPPTPVVPEPAEAAPNV